MGSRIEVLLFHITYCVARPAVSLPTQMFHRNPKERVRTMQHADPRIIFKNQEYGFNRAGKGSAYILAKPP